MCEEDTFYIDSGVEKIAVTIDHSPEKTKPAVLCLHGAGPHNRNRIKYITKALSLVGVSSIRFDFSGHKDSSGEMKYSSLSKRLKEALDVCDYLDPDIMDGYTVIATSMGGHIALELLSRIKVKNLILFCPAAYADEAFELPFGGGFSEVIRKDKSYMGATVFKNLQQFKGNMLLFIGDDDAVIPEDVVDLYVNSAVATRTKVVRKMPNAPHSIHVWLDKNPEFKEIVVSEVKKLVLNQ